MDFDRPVTDEVIQSAAPLPQSRIMVYLLNGEPYRAGVRLRLRRPIKVKGQWFVRDHGRVPLRGVDAKGEVFTT